MRKIKSEEDLARSQRRNNIVLGVVMIGLLVLSSVGYSVMSADNDKAYAAEELGFKFVRSGGFWVTEVNGEVFHFEYLPSEIADVEVNLSLGLDNYRNEVLYLVGSGDGASEILNNLNGYILRYQGACLGDAVDLNNQTYVVPVGECDGDFPVKACDNNLIVFEEGDGLRVYSDESCVYVVGDLRSTDAFLYKILGII
jgi:hypothetical protein